MFKVIRSFHDLTDAVSTKAGMIFHFYEVGDVYPRPGVDRPSEARVYELASSENRRGEPMIAAVDAEGNIIPFEVESTTEMPVEAAPADAEPAEGAQAEDTAPDAGNGAEAPAEAPVEPEKAPARRRKTAKKG